MRRLWANVRDVLMFGFRVAGVAGLGLMLAAAFHRGYDWLTTSPDFAIETVHVSGLSRVSRDALLERMGVFHGENVFAVDLKLVRERAERDPWVRSAHVVRKLPNALEVTVEEHVPALLVNLGALYVVDTDGTVFKPLVAADALDLPVLTGLERDAWTADPEGTRDRITRAIPLADLYAKLGPPDAELSEIQMGADVGATLVVGSQVTRVHVDASGVAATQEQLRRFALVWERLKSSQQVASEVRLDRQHRPEWATVRLAQR